MADKNIYIDDRPKNPELRTSPFDWTYTNNLTGKFGQVRCVMMKYLPPKAHLKIKPYFGFDMQPLVYPIQTNVRCHIKFYNVPLRILWKHAEDFFSQIGTNGLPTNGGGEQFVVPYIKRPSGWNALGSLAEQIGCSNVKYKLVNHIVESMAYHFKGSYVDGVLLPVSANSNTNFYYLSKIKLGAFLSGSSVVSGDNTLTNTHFIISATSSSSSRPYSGGTFIVRAFRKAPSSQQVWDSSRGEHMNVPHSLRLISETVFSEVTVSVNRYENDFPGNVVYSDPGVSTNVNGVSVKLYTYYFKIKDSAFLQAVNSVVQAKDEVFIQILPTGTYYDFFFGVDGFRSPLQEKIVSTYQRISPKADDPQTLEYSSSTYVPFNSTGATGSVRFGVSFVSTSSEIDTKFDSVDGADPVQPICALPFRALEFIHNYFMRNPRIDPFIKDGVPTYNRFLTNVESGADETTPVESWNALYESDYFTTCVKEPQFGNAPLVGVTVNKSEDGQTATGMLNFDDGTGFNKYGVKLDIGQDGQVMPPTAYPEDADHPNLHRLNELINYGISINDLRNVGTFQRMLERMQRTDYRFANVIYEFFGTNPPIGDHYPRYLGGVTRNISVDKITNIAQSDGNPLGSFAGQGKVSGEGKTISVFTTEPSYIVAIQYFTVTPCYSQYLPKHLLYTDPLDFYINPEFAYMGPQPVFKKELAPNQISVEHLNDIFGYNRPYAELFGNVDEVHGLFKTDMANFLLQRFIEDPNLNKSFIEINPADLTNVFAVTENSDKLWGQILFKMSVTLPAPRSYLPRSI